MRDKLNKNDRNDTDSTELMLIRAGHHVWSLYRRAKSQDGGYPSESGPFWEALQTLWKVKKDYRVELAQKRAAKAVLVRERFKAMKLPARPYEWRFK